MFSLLRAEIRWSKPIVFVILTYSKIYTMDTLWHSICDLLMRIAHKKPKACFVYKAQCPVVVVFTTLLTK